MQLHNCLLIAVSCVFSFLPLSVKAADSVQGQVLDSNGTPLAGVAWKISGIEELRDSKWTRVMRSGLPLERFTDPNGGFAVIFHSPIRYDLQFYQSGFAPAFLYEIAADSTPLKVTLKRGESIHGTVTHLIDGNWKPAIGETVTLRLPSYGHWYQKLVSTDANGKFEFRACAASPEPPIPPHFGQGQDPSPKRKWQLVCAGKVVEVNVVDGKPVETIDFKIETQAKKSKTVTIRSQPSGATVQIMGIDIGKTPLQRKFSFIETDNYEVQVGGWPYERKTISISFEPESQTDYFVYLGEPGNKL